MRGILGNMHARMLFDIKSVYVRIEPPKTFSDSLFHTMDMEHAKSVSKRPDECSFDSYDVHDKEDVHTSVTVDLNCEASRPDKLSEIFSSNREEKRSISFALPKKQALKSDLFSTAMEEDDIKDTINSNFEFPNLEKVYISKDDMESNEVPMLLNESESSIKIFSDFLSSLPAPSNYAAAKLDLIMTMKKRFLMGEDDIDYNVIDNNDNYDDLVMEEMDNQDAYFNSSSD